jgi:hypothetical protein
MAGAVRVRRVAVVAAARQVSTALCRRARRTASRTCVDAAPLSADSARCPPSEHPAYVVREQAPRPVSTAGHAEVGRGVVVWVYREALADDEEFVPLDPRCDGHPRWPFVARASPTSLRTVAVSVAASDCSMHTPSTAGSTHRHPPLQTHIAPSGAMKQTAHVTLEAALPEARVRPTTRTVARGGWLRALTLCHAHAHTVRTEGDGSIMKCIGGMNRNPWNLAKQLFGVVSE